MDHVYYTRDVERRVCDFIEEVWNSKNIDACSKYIASTYTIRHDPGDPWEGRTLDLQTFKDRIAYYLAAFPDQRFTIQEIFYGRHSVVCRWLWKGTHLGQFADYPPSFQKLFMSGLTIYYGWRSSLCGHWQIIDRMGLFQQLQQFGVQIK